jgi:hypothetical protein
VDVHHKGKIIDPCRRDDDTPTTSVASPSNPAILALHLNLPFKELSAREEHPFAKDHHNSATEYAEYFSPGVAYTVKCARASFVM